MNNKIFLLVLCIFILLFVSGCNSSDNDCCTCKDCPECDVCCSCKHPYLNYK